MAYKNVSCLVSRHPVQLSTSATIPRPTLMEGNPFDGEVAECASVHGRQPNREVFRLSQRTFQFLRISMFPRSMCLPDLLVQLDIRRFHLIFMSTQRSDRGRISATAMCRLHHTNKRAVCDSSRR